MRNVVPGLLGLCLCAAIVPFGAVEFHHALFAFGFAGLLALIWAGKLLFARTPLWKPSPMHWPVFGFVVYTVMRYWFSPYEYESRLETFQIVLYGLVYFIAANNVNRGRERTVVLGILLVLGTAEAMYGIWQGYTKSYYTLNAERPSVFSFRGSGTFICPNHLAGLLEMVLGFALARLALYRPADRESIEVQLLNKVTLAYALIAMIVGLLLTFSRGGWFATAIGLVVFLAWGGFRGRAMWRQLAAGAGALCVLVLLLFAIPSTRNYLRLTMSPKTEEASVPLREPSLKGRTVLWSATWRIIQDHPILGTGVGTWQWVHQKYREPAMQATADYAHNDILQTTSEYGVVGAGLIVAVLIGFYRHARRLGTEGVTSEQRAFAMGALLAVTILLVHSWFDFNLHIPGNALFFCAILGLVAGMEVPEGPYSARPLKPPMRYGLVVGLLLLVGLGMHFIVPTARAVQYTETGNMEKRYLHWDDAIAWYEAALDADPKYPEPHIKLGDIYFRQAQFRVGEDKKQERLELCEKAIKRYRAAFEMNRSRGDLLSKIAWTYEIAGDADRARKSFELALLLD
ncbi:MAG TPA: O-antigen ligase family protein, partial [Candidatus Eisenbacteria bacterium]|nr:O-antigen ligase family protein [Candidatus Eisenbacteria bacterium]